MKKSTFIISKMDCPAEEQMIRMKLESSIVVGMGMFAQYIPGTFWFGR